MSDEVIRFHKPARDEDGWHIYREAVRGEVVTLRRYRFFDAESAERAYAAFTRTLERRRRPGGWRRLAAWWHSRAMIRSTT